MIGRFLDAGHRVGWVAADEVYGGHPKLRTALEERKFGYVLAVAPFTRTHHRRGEVPCGRPGREGAGAP